MMPVSSARGMSASGSAAWGSDYPARRGVPVPFCIPSNAPLLSTCLRLPSRYTSTWRLHTADEVAILCESLNMSSQSPVLLFTSGQGGDWTAKFSLVASGMNTPGVRFLSSMQEAVLEELDCTGTEDLLSCSGRLDSRAASPAHAETLSSVLSCFTAQAALLYTWFTAVDTCKWPAGLCGHSQGSLNCMSAASALDTTTFQLQQRYVESSAVL